MALVNRDKDASEQRDVVTAKLGSQVTGATVLIGVVPYPCLLQSARSSIQGASGAMQLAFSAIRFFPGTGVSTIALGISNMVLSNAGLSGVLGYSGLAAAGSTLLQLQAGDVLIGVTSVANTACTDLVVSLVLKKLQDVVSVYGLSS